MVYNYLNNKKNKCMHHQDHHAHHISIFKTRFWISLVLTIPILALSPMFMMIIGLGNVPQFKGQNAVLFALSTIVYFYGGWPFLKGLYSELSQKMPGMMTLVGLAITIAYIFSTAVLLGAQGDVFFWELATLIDIMLLGHWIEMRSVMGAGKALEALAGMLPDKAHVVLDNGEIVLVHLFEVAPGQNLLIRSGERIPADGIVIDGNSTVNESMLTGESRPIGKVIGDAVLGGSVNYEGTLTIKVTQVGEEAYLSKVINMVKQAQASKSPSQDLANRAARWLTLIAISVGVTTFILWSMVFDGSFSFAIERAVTVMITTCPHALGLAIPLVIAVSTSLAASHGFLIRSRDAFEKARQIDAVIFDKTGTLTSGDFVVTDTVPIKDKITPEQVMEYAGSLEKFSEHPIAKAIAASCQKFVDISDYESRPGIGTEGKLKGKLIQVVSPGYLQEQGLDRYHTNLIHLAHQGKTLVYVLFDHEVIGAIALADKIRPESYNAISALKKMNIRCMMLTGDNKFVAKYVADELGIDEYIAEILPGAKANRVKDIQSRGVTVAMVGDGVNDAPALAQANVGIAIGAGTEVAIESADVILVKNNPEDVASLIQLSRLSYRKMVQNLFWATGYNLFAIPAAAGVFYVIGFVMSPAMGAVLMSLSTIVCAINARLLRMNP